MGQIIGLLLAEDDPDNESGPSVVLEIAPGPTWPAWMLVDVQLGSSSSSSATSHGGVLSLGREPESQVEDRVGGAWLVFCARGQGCGSRVGLRHFLGRTFCSGSVVGAVMQSVTATDWSLS